MQAAPGLDPTFLPQISTRAQFCEFYAFAISRLGWIGGKVMDPNALYAYNPCIMLHKATSGNPPPEMMMQGANLSKSIGTF